MKLQTIADVERFLSIQTQALGEAHPEVAATICRLADMYRAANQTERAQQLYEKAVSILENAPGAEPSMVQNAKQRLNKLLDGGIRTKTGNARSTRSHDILGFSATDPNMSLSNIHLERTEHKEIDLDAAIRDAEIEIRLIKDVVGAIHPAVADSLTKLADFHCRKHQYEEMEPLLKEALAIREKICGSEHSAVATELKNLGRLYVSLARFEEAEPLYERSIQIRRKLLGANHPKTLDIEEHYAKLLRKTGRHEEAEALDSRIGAQRSRQAGGMGHFAGSDSKPTDFR